MSTLSKKKREVSLNDFLSIDNFKNLRLKYLSKCFDRDCEYSTNYTDNHQEDFFILQAFDDVIYDIKTRFGTHRLRYKNLYFIKDYLKIQIPYAAEVYKGEIAHKVARHYLADKKERINFITYQKHLLNKLYEGVEIYSFLGEELLEVLRTQILKTLEFINEDSHLEEQVTNLGKIPISLPEIDFINIMIALADQGFIKTYNDVDLASIIENNFTIYKGKEQGKKAIKNCYRKINGYRNGSKPNNKSLERIRELMSKI